MPDRSTEVTLENLVAFSEFLRNRNLPVTSSETIDAVRSILHTRIERQEDFFLALRSCLLKRAGDMPLFETLFDQFWSGKVLRKDRIGLEGRLSKTVLPKVSKLGSLKSVGSKAQIPYSVRLGYGAPDSTSTDIEESRVRAGSLYSPTESLRGRKFDNFYELKEIQALKRGLKRFTRQFSTYPGRRFVSSESGTIDVPSSLRRSLGTAGEVTYILRSERKLTRPRLVILCDISGSMDSYSDEIIAILYYACNIVKRVDVFGFSTRIVQLNQFLVGKSLREAKSSISENVKIWSSGTRIGSALGELIQHYSGVLRSRSVLLILSDGWELGDLQALESNLAEARRRVSKIIWINPLADSPDYKPITAGMEIAVPLVDLLCGLRIFSEREAFSKAVSRADNALRVPLTNS
ncbi:MAG TPA: VWA domain-containing protein [Nitrososphaerales archaeon]|nr:VWA domain-containing protein [Nitrososphaerales archaeon]